MRKSWLLGTCVMVMALSVTALAGPVGVVFDPATKQAILGNGFTLNIDAALIDDGADNVNAFEFFFAFDPAILSLDDVVFGAAINEGNPSNSFQNWSVSAGQAEICELDMVSNALPSQPGAFTLATLHFTPIALGSTPLSFDAQGSIVLGPTQMQPFFEDGQVTVQAPSGDDTPTVPVPTSLSLVVLGLAGLKLRRKQRLQG